MLKHVELAVIWHVVFWTHIGDEFDVILEVGENTGIEAVATKTSNKVYTIDGRMVNAKAGEKLAKGLYIVGGKKIYVK